MSKVIERSNFVSTSLQGYLIADYDTLVSVFGEPQYVETSGDGKVDIEWEMAFVDEDNDGDTVFPFTIYNWKDYDGGLRARTEDNYQWHIGGTSGITSVLVISHFEENTQLAEAV
jgi:hypothetical protein